MQANKSKKPHTRLLRRRHSLPETIMRKHQLAKQKQLYSSVSASSAPSPPAQERVPTSFESQSRERTQTSSSYSSLGSSASTIVVNGFASTGCSTGSDSNLNRSFPSNGSMRQQLLRRLWHKEYRPFDRTGSLSPPLHRSLRTKRALKFQGNQPDICLECQRLEANFNHSVPEIASHHIQHNNSSTTTTSKTSSFAFARKSYYIKTETVNDTSMLAISTASSGPKSPKLKPKKSTQSESISTSTSNQMNVDSILDDQINGNIKMSNDSYLIEMDDDRINITTMAVNGSVADTSSMVQMSSAEPSTVSQLSNQWHDLSNSDSINNNNSRSSENGTSAKITEIGRMHGGVYDAYHMSSGEVDMENESVIRFKAHEPLDQSTIDTIISQILVDSLNNIIVVQGVHQRISL